MSKPGRQVSISIACGTTPKSPSKEVAPSSVSCCGCFDIRAGVFAILIFHLALDIYGIISDMNSGIARIQSTDIVISYVLFGISAIVYLVLLYAAAMRIVQVYRAAAKVNVVLFFAGLGLTVVTVAMGTQPDLNDFSPSVLIVSFAIVFVWFGYWTWVLYKYANVLEAEAKDKEQKHGVSV